MDKFLQQFKDNLDNQPAPEFDEQDWADMQQRLNQQAVVQRKPINYWAWAAVLLLLGMLGTNWFVLQALKKATTKINRLETHRDTIIRTKIIYRTDTIFQTMYGQWVNKATQNTLTKDNIANQYSTTTGHSPSEKNEEVILSTNTPLGTQKNIQPPLSQKQLDLESVVISNSPKEESSKTVNFENPIENLSYKNLQETSVDVNHQRPQLPILSNLGKLDQQILATKKHPLPSWFETPIISIHRRKTFQQYIYPMRPKGIAIGLHHGRGTTFQDTYQQLKINEWGVTAQIKFSQPFRLWLTGNVTDLDYESKEMGDKYGVPIIAAPTDNLEFKDANVRRDIWSASMGLQYNFNASQPWQTFIGVGYGFSNMTQNEIQYEFTAASMGGNQGLSLKERVVYENGKNLPFAVFKSGLSYDLTNKWRLQLEGEYLYRIADFNNQLPHILSGRIGILYAF